MKLDVLSVMHFMAEAWKFVSLAAIKNCSEKCGLSVDHVYSNENNAPKLTKMKKMSGIVCSLLECSLRTT